MYITELSPIYHFCS